MTYKLSEIDKLECIEISLVQPDIRFRLIPHSHKFNELIMVIRGKYKVKTEKKHLIELTPGTIIYYPPDILHCPSYPLDQSVMFFVLQWKGFKLNPRPFTINDISNQIFDWLWTMRILTHENNKISNLLLNCLLKAIILQLIRLRSSSSSTDLVDLVKTYLEYNYANNAISIGEISRLFNVSKEHIIRKFKKKTGLIPAKYLQFVRISTATRLLRTTNLPLKEIAHRVGFKSNIYLARLIKRYTGKIH